MFPIGELNEVAKELIVFLAEDLASDDTSLDAVNAVPGYYLTFFHGKEIPIPAKMVAIRRHTPKPTM